MTLRPHRGALVGLLVLGAAQLLPAVAVAQDAGPEADVRVEQVTTDPEGLTRVVIGVTGLRGEPLTAETVTITENGRAIEALTVEPAGNTEVADAPVPATMIAIDASGSAIGLPLTEAVAAATQLAAEVDGLVGIVSFADTVEVPAPLGSPPEVVDQALAGIVAGGETSLYDGVSRAVRILSEHDGPRDLVIFSDGADTVSNATLPSIRSLAVDEDVRITAVALTTPETSTAPLQLLAGSTGGQLAAVLDAEDLGTAFSEVTADLTSRWALTYEVAAVRAPAAELDLVVSVDTETVSAQDTAAVFNNRLPSPAPPTAVTPPSVPVDVLTDNTGLFVGVGAAGLAVLLLAMLAFGVGQDRKRLETLRQRIGTADEAGSQVADADVEEASTLMARAASVAERLPRPTAVDTGLDLRLERADWPMRSTEFLLVTAAAGLGFGLVMFILGGGAGAVLGVLVGLAGPFGALTVAVGRRQRAFTDQVPDVLQVIAAAVRAGHSFATAIEGSVDEVGEPAQSELRRVAFETRLGRPVEDALMDVAVRTGSDDLRWVVTAVTIQRQVGGNLAEVLGNVTRTLRDRAALGRQVRALSAEGRLSAAVIGGMPIVLFLILTATNPTYLNPLVTDPRGRLMVIVGLVLFAAGVAWLRRIVRPIF